MTDPLIPQKTPRTLRKKRKLKIKFRIVLKKKKVIIKSHKFMTIKSVRKKDMEISLNISNSDGSSHSLERKQCIKYLGVMIDESLTWKYHIAFVCSRISRNIGIISKLRRYLQYLYSNGNKFTIILPLHFI